MNNYVLVIVDGNNYKIGRNRYTKERALQRQAEVAKLGIKMEVMREDEAFGIA